MADPARPRFFDGQYIGADDLEAIGDYAAARQREHLLAAHGWGVAAGLDLIETAQADGSIAVWLQPGYGWDGYGRAMAVRAPIPAPIDQLRGLPSGAWFVWLAYREAGRDAARASYGVCDGTDLYQRVMESCELRITGALPLDLQQSGVAYGGATRPDARLARRAFEPDGPVVCDAAIPEQGAPPKGTKSLWLVPLGLVGWDDEAQRLRALAETERLAARTMRRYVGTVAESILAPDGLIRLKDRNVYKLVPDPSATDQICGRFPLGPSDLSAKGPKVRPNELVWVEGHLRAYGDARLFGGELELRSRDGAAPQGAMALRRRAAPAAGPQTLEIAIGVAEGAGLGNRLKVGPLRDPNAVPPDLKPAFVVRADGHVGVGTETPELTLDVAGDFGHLAGPTTLRLMGSRVADLGDGKLSVTSGGRVLVLGDEGHRVGVNVKDPAPDVALDVNGGLQIRSSPAFARLLGSEISDTGDGVLRIRSGGGTVAFDGFDRVGVRTATPQGDLALDVKGGIGSTATPAFVRLLGSVIEDRGDGVLRIKSGGATVTFDGADKVGVGTDAPSATLDVRGPANVSGVLTAQAGLFAGAVWLPSDVRLKRDVRPLEGALDTLLSLRGVSFHWRDDARGSGRQFGLIADEVEKVLPHWVSTDPFGHKHIGSSGFEGLAAEAMRELTQRVEALEAEAARLRSANTTAVTETEAARPKPRSKTNSTPKSRSADSKARARRGRNVKT